MAMDELLHTIDQLEIADEDGNPRPARWNRPLTGRELDALETRIGARLPASYRQFLMRGDGGDLFGLCLQGMAARVLVAPGLLTFHDWGNGDFDCLGLGPDPNQVPILFMNHSPEVVVRIADSFEHWLSSIVEELRRDGTVAHPGDYRYVDSPGLYAEVLQKLTGVDCELNR
jgi:hypothetical protein